MVVSLENLDFYAKGLCTYGPIFLGSKEYRTLGFYPFAPSLLVYYKYPRFMS